MPRFDVQEATEFVTDAIENPQHSYFVWLDLRLDFLLTATAAVLLVAFTYWAAHLLSGQK